LRKRFKPFFPIKEKKKIHPILKLKELKKLLEVATNERNKLILKFMYDTGLRISELSNLKKKHFDWTNLKGTVYKGKGNKDRIFYYSNLLSTELRKFDLNKNEKA